MHPIATRSTISHLKVPSLRTEQAKSKISYSGESLFNSLCSELKDIENHSINSYKKNLKTYFLQLNTSAIAYDGDTKCDTKCFKLPARYHGQFGRQFQAHYIYTRYHGQFGR